MRRGWLRAWAPACRPCSTTSMQLLSLQFVLLIGSLLTVPVCYGQQPVEVTVSTGQQLADAIAEWGTTGSNMTISIDVSYISMRGVSFENYTSATRGPGNTKPFSAGTLIIDGLENSTILDIGMQPTIIPPLSYPARYTLQNLVTINACDADNPIYINVPGCFGISLAYQSQFTTNVTLYRSQATLAVSLYVAIMRSSSGIPGLEGDTTEVKQLYKNVPDFSPYMQGVGFYESSLGVYRNVTQKSLASPDDPLLNQLKAEGRIMPLQYCNGTLVPDDLDEVDALRGPLRVVSDQESFETALERTAAQTAIQLRIKGPPAGLMVMKRSPYSLTNASTLAISSPMILLGNNPLPAMSDRQLPWLNLNQYVGVFELAQPQAQVMIQWLAFRGLAAEVPTRVPATLPPGTALLPSAFPLAAFKVSPGLNISDSALFIAMSNVTLVIPPDDFTALVILAARQSGQDSSDCLDAAMLQRVAQLQAGFTKMATFSLPSAEAAQQALIFRELQGWGLTATMLRLLPATPVSTPDCSSPTSSSSRSIIGLSVGIACGFMIILCIGWALFKRRSGATEGPRKGSYTADGMYVHSPASPSVVEQGSFMHNPLFAADDPPHVPASQQQSPRSLLQQGVQAASEKRLAAFDSAAAVDLSRHASDGAQEQGMLTPNDLREQVQLLAAQLGGADDKLELSGVLGSGSSGTVFMGTWKGLKVAVKTMIVHDRHGLLNQLPFLQPAFMEAAIAASLGHRNVVITYHCDIKALAPAQDTQRTGGLQINAKEDAPAYKVFLVQELCDASLDIIMHNRLLQRPDSELLDLASALYVMLDIAQGLAYLHSQGIIHGDLKPENILMKLDPGAPYGVVAKLADFGLSRKLGPGDTHVSNWRCGTPFYVAPEVVNNRQVSPASDMYSFGIIIWSMVNQSQPYVSAPNNQLVWHSSFPSLTGAGPLPPDLVQLFDRCFTQDPRGRPTANEAVKQLRRLWGLVRR